MGAGAKGSGRPKTRRRRRQGRGAGGRGRSAHGELFPAGALDEMCRGVEPTAGQEQAAAEWLGLLRQGRLADEKRNYPRFVKVMLEDVLGYPAMQVDHERDNVAIRFVLFIDLIRCHGVYNVFSGCQHLITEPQWLIIAFLGDSLMVAA